MDAAIAAQEVPNEHSHEPRWEVLTFCFRTKQETDRAACEHRKTANNEAS
jgi:hypothetical protein